jgi:hypothetical protein
MPATPTPAPTPPTPPSGDERVELANQLYREFHARCFWHSPRDLVITEDLIPFVVKGLRTHGGRRGFILSGKLRPKGRPARSPRADYRGIGC